MANFKIAYDITGRNEGGYADKPNDHGGETYAGIARKFWPEWEGWLIVDNYKTISHTVEELNAFLKKDTGIQISKMKFYKENFWDVNKLDQVNDQQIANNVYDTGVNMGTGVAAKYLQLAVAVNNDGIVGSKTLAAVNNTDPETIFNKINKLREDKYRRLAQEDDQAEFLSDWLSRLKTYIKA